jgi:hypothetical protein
MEYPEAIGLDDVGPRKINNKPSILMTRRSSPGERLLPMDQGEVDRGKVSKRGGSGQAVENTKDPRAGRKRSATPLTNTKEVGGWQ